MECGSLLPPCTAQAQLAHSKKTCAPAPQHDTELPGEEMEPSVQGKAPFVSFPRKRESRQDRRSTRNCLLSSAPSALLWSDAKHVVLPPKLPNRQPTRGSPQGNADGDVGAPGNCHACFNALSSFVVESVFSTFLDSSQPRRVVATPYRINLSSVRSCASVPIATLTPSSFAFLR